MSSIAEGIERDSQPYSNTFSRNVYYARQCSVYLGEPNPLKCPLDYLYFIMTSRKNTFQQMSNQHRGEGAPSRSVPQGYGSGQRGYPRSPQPLPSDGRASGRDAPPRGHGAHIYEPPPTPAPPMGYGLPTNPPHSNQFWLPPSATTESYHVPEPSTPISRPQRGGLTSGAGVGQPQGVWYSHNYQFMVLKNGV